jgi:pyruvate-formate lyase-activating enzyme
MQVLEPGDRGPVRLLVATEDGEVYDHPSLEVLPPTPGDLPPGEYGGPELFRPVPDGSRIVLLPGRKAVGWDAAARRRAVPETLSIGGRERPVFAAAAVLAPAWLRMRCPAFERREAAPELPQWAYTDVGWRGGRAVAATVRIDSHTHWDTRAYNTPDLEGRVKRRLAAAPGNGVLRQLARCALEYSCTTAQNIFYQRHEGALPVSAACNSECLGCLSYRPPGGAPSSHERVSSTARTEDLVEVALEHLRAVPRGIVSFGQGCEGEPLLAGERIERAIHAIRARTRAGTLHLNTNASLPSMVARLFNAGLDSIRVSLNSAVPERYARYYKPSGYTFEEVRGSIAVARGKGGFVSLNYLVHPGFSDRPSEITALVSLTKECEVDQIQMRNLAIDPAIYLALYPEPEAPAGMGELLRRLRQECPRTRLGNFNLPKEEWNRQAVGAGAGAATALHPRHPRRP